jgi:hypothetical protein
MDNHRSRLRHHQFSNRNECRWGRLGCMALVLVSALAFSACKKGVTGSCDSRLVPDGVIFDIESRLWKDQCREYIDVEDFGDPDMRSKCESGKVTGTAGTWTEGSGCSRVDVAATCRDEWNGGSVTNVYYKEYATYSVVGLSAEKTTCEAKGAQWNGAL